MPKQLTKEELREWYARFSKELYEKANIDVNRVEDLGRVKNFKVVKWDYTQVLNPEVVSTYAFVPQKDMQYEVEPPAMNHKDFREYGQWLRDNLVTNVSDEHIQQLYDMSRAGNLMVVTPGESVGAIQQVYTDENGQISTTLPAIAYTGDRNVRAKYTIPGKDPMENYPVAPRDSDNPVEYGLKPLPQMPPRPANMNPGFWSWLGARLGFDTDFAKLERYTEAMITYDAEKSKWDNDLRERLTNGDENATRYDRARVAHQQYKKEFEAFQKDPLSRTLAISMTFQFGLDVKRTTWLQKEAKYLLNQHYATPTGQLTAKLRQTQEDIGAFKRTERVVRNLLGHDPSPWTLREWIDNGVFKSDEYKPAKMALPKNPYNRETQSQEWDGFEKKWAAMAEIAGFAALTDPSVSGTPAFEGFTAQETAKLNYSMILSNLITNGRPSSSNYLQFLQPAREVGMKAVHEYAAGDPTKMAQLLTNHIRQTNREAANISNLNSKHAINTLYLMDRMLKVVDADPDLKAKMSLTDEEMQEARGLSALYQVARKGLESKELLLKHALYQVNLSPEALKQACQDVLFANAISDGMEDARNKEDAVRMQTDTGYIAAKNAQEAASAAHTMAKAELEMAQATNAADVEQKRNAADQLRKQYDHATHQVDMLDLQRPACELGAKLLRPKWVEGAVNGLLNHTQMDMMMNMSRLELGKTFATTAAIKKTFNMNLMDQPENAPVQQMEQNLDAVNKQVNML